MGRVRRCCEKGRLRRRRCGRGARERRHSGRRFQELRGAGYRLIDVEGYRSGNQTLYADIWVENDEDRAWREYRNLASREQARRDTYAQAAALTPSALETREDDR